MRVRPEPPRRGVAAPALQGTDGRPAAGRRPQTHFGAPSMSMSLSVLPSAERDTFRGDVLRGLGRPHRALPCKYFYGAGGSRLFDAICDLPEYYPTRCELEALRRHGGRIANLLGPRCALVEYGSGSGLKT